MMRLELGIVPGRNLRFVISVPRNYILSGIQPLDDNEEYCIVIGVVRSLADLDDLPVTWGVVVEGNDDQIVHLVNTSVGFDPLVSLEAVPAVQSGSSVLLYGVLVIW